MNVLEKIVDEQGNKLSYLKKKYKIKKKNKN